MTRNRLSGLDALRGVAALSVMIYHYTWHFSGGVEHTSSPIINMPFGYFGVDLFFMISGYVIFMTLDRVPDIRAFAMGRIGRLYPAFLIGLTVTCLIRLAHNPAPIDQIAGNLTMMPGLFNVMPVDPSYWSLAYEWVFYGWAALFFALVDRKHTELAVLMLIGVSELRYALPSGSESTLARFAQFGLLGGWAPLFGVGIMTYRIMTGSASRITYMIIPACLVIAGRAIDYRGPMLTEFEHTAILFAIFGLFWVGLKGWLPRIVMSPLLFLGSISYSLYLIHQELGIALIRQLEGYGVNPDVAIVLVSGFVILVAWVMRRFVEIPGQRWIKSMRTNPSGDHARSGAVPVL